MKKSLLWTVLLFLPLLGANDKEIFWNTYTAALRGEKEAQFQTGVMFERGIGTDENQSQAAKWYEKASLQGHMDAQYNIGIMYASGRGVEQNDQFAMMWLASSAKQGDKESRKLLLGLIDGKTNTEIKPVVTDNPAKISFNQIKPIRIETKEGASICNAPNMNECNVLKVKQIFTSKSKQGNYYKISGIVTGHGWQDYESDSWIEESMVHVE